MLRLTTLLILGFAQALYDNTKVIRIPPTSATADVEQSLKEAGAQPFDDGKPNEVEFMVPEEAFEKVSAVIQDFKVLSENLEQTIQDLFDENKQRCDAPGADFFDGYRTLDEYMEFYYGLEREFSRLVNIETVGQSIEGRDIIKVTLGQRQGGRKKKSVFVVGLIHSREWVSGSTVAYLAYRLLNDTRSRDRRLRAEARDLLNTLDIVIMPVTNPDGYAYTWETDRLWRKNRNTDVPPASTGEPAVGVDLNRQFNNNWGKSGTAPGFPESNIYPGAYPESEPEAKAIANTIRSLDKCVAAVDIHSYGQLLLYPYEHQAETGSVHDAQFADVTGQMATAIQRTHGVEYAPGRGATLYQTSGTTSDWFYTIPQFERVFGGERKQFQPYGITVELRPADDEIGFLLPPDQIIPTGEEMFNGLKVLFFNARDDPLYVKLGETVFDWDFGGPIEEL